MRESAGDAAQGTTYYPESPFDCFLKDALMTLYQRRDELNRLIRDLNAARPRRRPENMIRMLRTSSH